jgi:hypothetical protein
VPLIFFGNYSAVCFVTVITVPLFCFGNYSDGCFVTVITVPFVLLW